jgi:VanZ family protein
VRAGRIFRSFLPILIWMLLIYGGSTELGATRNTSRIIAPILRWLNPKVTWRTINDVQFVVRKCGHATEYGILCLLVWRALRNLSDENPPVWNWTLARRAIFISALYASTDEFHQTFVASREGRVHDVVIDTSGAILAMLFLWRIGLRFNWWKNSTELTAA